MRHLLQFGRDALSEYGLLAFAVIVLLWSLLATVLFARQVVSIDRTLLGQTASLRATLQRHEALLNRVEQDEHRMCAAARASGSSEVVHIVCPKGTP